MVDILLKHTDLDLQIISIIIFSNLCLKPVLLTIIGIIILSEFGLFDNSSRLDRARMKDIDVETNIYSR